MKRTGENVVRIEAEALRALADRIAGPMAAAFERAVELLHACAGRVVVTGLGKSGIVARKIAATLSSTGTPSLFLHPAEALHGDLGMLARGDVVIALSSSGETEEIVRLLPTVKRIGAPLISMTGDNLFGSKNPRNRSTLTAAADVALDCSIAQEACSLGLAPTASTTTMMALGDALAVALADKRGFKEADFADLHPGGKLGKKLARVSSLMHAGEAMPKVTPKTQMSDVIYEMSRKGLGITTVVEKGKLVGVISDGDLRRLLERRSKTKERRSKTKDKASKAKGKPVKDVLELTAAECMTRNPRTVAPDAFAAAALGIMEEKKITSLVVVDSKGRPQGILHLHDLWGTEMV
ncbi:MAG TPA: KpsF/GutQ family sugar-phosphate isomerase [Terriglobales bacterium]|nr:KpsF/GutQ family sugar-phosphate isomerase [Terriglobales bacterium]